MSSRGRRSLVSAEERARILELAEKRVSQRKIAEEVLGDSRLRGRVERVLAEHRRSEAAPTFEPEAGAQAEDADLPTLEQLVARYKRSLDKRLNDPSEKVTAQELEALARLELRVENMRQYQRIRALTRHRQRPESESKGAG
jgi:hypothetical protein